MTAVEMPLVTTSKSAENSNLDLLRSFAVLAVLADHTLQNIGIYRIGPFDVVHIGLFGVYLFFLHTSLVLMWSLERRPHSLDFYVRRAFRIYPLMIVVALVVITLNLPTAGQPYHPFVHPSRTPATIASNLLLIQNLVGRPSVETVMWTLPLEMQMYLALPMLFVFARKERMLWPLLLLWGLCAAAIQAVMPQSANSITPNIITVVPFFLCGAIAFVGFMRRAPRIPSWLFLPVVVAFTLFYMRHWAMHTAWLACVVLALALPSFRQATRSSWVKAGHVIAKYSYGIYLLHQIGLVVAFYYLPIHSLALKLLVEFGVIAILVPLAYHFVEEPLIEKGKRVASRLQERYENAMLKRDILATPMPIDDLQ